MTCLRRNFPSASTCVAGGRADFSTDRPFLSLIPLITKKPARPPTASSGNGRSRGLAPAGENSAAACPTVRSVGEDGVRIFRYGHFRGHGLGDFKQIGLTERDLRRHRDYEQRIGKV